MGMRMGMGMGSRKRDRFVSSVMILRLIGHASVVSHEYRHKKDKGNGIVPRVPSKCIKVRSLSISN